MITRFDVKVGRGAAAVFLGRGLDAAAAKKLVMGHKGAYQVRSTSEALVIIASPAPSQLPTHPTAENFPEGWGGRSEIEEVIHPQTPTQPSPVASKSGKRFYAIAPLDGGGTRIIQGWSEARPLIDGQPVLHKGFKTRDEALQWLGGVLRARAAADLDAAMLNKIVARPSVQRTMKDIPDSVIEEEAESAALQASGDYCEEIYDPRTPAQRNTAELNAEGGIDEWDASPPWRE
jgi:hypothetical protein